MSASVSMAQRVRPLEAISIYSILIVLSAILLAPLSFMLSIALSSDATTVQQAFTLIPREFHWENFTLIWSDPQLRTYLKNSAIIVVWAIIGQVFASSMVAFAFARLRAPGKNVIFIILLTTLMIPGEVTLIPTFILFRELGWINTFLPLIVPNFFGSDYNIFLMRQFVSRIPIALDEAARIDGVSYFGIYWRIVLPLMRPALVAVAIFTFTFNWGWFLGPLIYLSDPNTYPLALGLQSLASTQNAAQAPPWNLVMVGAFLLTLPMMLVFFFGQRYMFELGISGGSAIK
jgi:multiple sugar transport system permease protein